MDHGSVRAVAPGEPLGPLTPGQASELERIQRQWKVLGESASGWAVAEVPGGPPGGASREEFLRTGVEEVRAVAARAAALAVPFTGARALDFGCGPGRMSQALVAHYGDVIGVDVSPAMAELARGLLASPLPCRFETTTDPDLRRFASETFDLTFSVYVLQHLPAWLAERYLREFARVIRPGGSIVFQFHGGLASQLFGWVSGRRLPRILNAARRWSSAALRRPMRWEVHWMRPREVIEILRSAGVRFCAVERVTHPDGRMQGYWFYGTRDPTPTR